MGRTVMPYSRSAEIESLKKNGDCVNALFKAVIALNFSHTKSCAGVRADLLPSDFALITV
jgi:hypothetical protein